MIEIFIESLIGFILVLWVMKNIVDALDYTQKLRQYNNNSNISKISYGMEVDTKTGSAEETTKLIT